MKWYERALKAAVKTQVYVLVIAGLTMIVSRPISETVYKIAGVVICYDCYLSFLTAVACVAADRVYEILRKPKV